MKRLLCALLLLSSFMGQAEIRLITEDSPPANYLDKGQITGPAVDIVKAIQNKVGHVGKLEVLPWTRGYQMAQNEKEIGLFSTTRTEEREKLFKWVGPLVTNKWSFFAKKDKGIKISNLDEAKKIKRIGTYTDDAKEQFLKNKGFTNLDSSPNDQANAKKLEADRIDLWFSGDEDLPIICKSKGIDPNQFEKVYTANEVKMYIAFSKDIPDTTIQKWQKAYDELEQDGTIAAIFKKY